MGATAKDLFRRGNRVSARMDHVRPDNDLPTFEHAGAIWVRAGSGGVSTCGRPNSQGHWWKAGEGSIYDDKLVVINDHGNHYSWEPAHDMPLQDYIDLLKGVNPLFSFDRTL